MPVELVQRAEELGYDSVWTAEAYGSDAVTPLAYLAAQDEAHQARHRHHAARRAHAGQCRDVRRRRSMRWPAAAASSPGSACRGPQIVEGWYGQPWGKPYYRMKDYVAIMRKIFAREEPVTHEGREISLPYTGEGATGRRQAAEVDPAHEPRHPDLSRHRQRGDGAS